MRRRPGATLCAALVLALPLPAQEEGRPATAVSTLWLDEPLASTGRLGGVAVDAAGNVYVSNFASTVWRVSPEGEVRALSSEFGQASGNTVSSRGTLLQSDFQRHAIFELDVETGERTPFVTGGLAAPVGLVEAPDGALFVCSLGNHAIARVAPGSSEAEVFVQNPLLRLPNGIATDPEGVLYVAGFGDDRVLRIDPAGAVSTLATVVSAHPGKEGEGREGNAHLAWAAGHLWVTKIKTNELYRVTPEGEVLLVAGTGAPDVVDGVGLSAALSRPNGVAAVPGEPALVTNGLVGPWKGGEPTEIVLRRIELR